MDVLREREEKDNFERQLLEEQKIRALLQKRLRRERRSRRKLHDQLETEAKRRAQFEEALKAAGAQDQINLINEKLSQTEQKSNLQKVLIPPQANHISPIDRERLQPPEPPRSMMLPERMERDREENPTASMPGYGQGIRETQPPPPPQADTKPWGYSGMDLINTGAAFWQNYSDSLAQELEMERKSRHQQVERDVKSPLQDRAAYYKNSVLFTSSAT